MKTPADLKYTKEHEWALVSGNNATFGITDHAQEKLSDIVFVELPEEGDEVHKNQPFGVVESVKAASDILAPLSGKVTAINNAVVDAPETINRDPYGEGWLVKVELSDPAEIGDLMDAEAYTKFVEEEQH